MNKRFLNVALCEGRHEIPEAVHGSIFHTEIQNVTDTKHLEIKAFDRLWTRCYANGMTEDRCYETKDGDDVGCFIASDVHVNLYVTGLTVALIAVLNVCREERIPVTLYHYDRESGKYFPQEVK